MLKLIGKKIFTIYAQNFVYLKPFYNRTLRICHMYRYLMDWHARVTHSLSQV